MATILNPIAIATSVVENVSSGNGGEFVWPLGAWRGNIEEAEQRDLPSTQQGEPFMGYTSTDGERISFRLGDNKGLDGQDDVGARKFFVDLVLRDGQYDVSTPYADIPREAWQLSRSQLALVRLADALGQTTKDGENTLVEPGFIEALAAGQFNGQSVGYIVKHRQNKDKSRTFADIQTFFPA